VVANQKDWRGQRKNRTCSEEVEYWVEVESRLRKSAQKEAERGFFRQHLYSGMGGGRCPNHEDGRRQGEKP